MRGCLQQPRSQACSVLWVICVLSLRGGLIRDEGSLPPRQQRGEWSQKNAVPLCARAIRPIKSTGNPNFGKQGLGFGKVYVNICAFKLFVRRKFDRLSVNRRR